jgi:hypothetical protein
MPLNKNRPFGTISPGYNGASYEQVGTDGVTRYYNGEGYEVDVRTGKVVEGPETAGAAKSAVATEDNGKSVAERAREILEQKDKPPFAKFALKAAALIGGDNPPSTKTEIVAALTTLAEKPKPAPVEVQAVPDAAKSEATPKPVDEPIPLVGDETVNLRAWGRGEQQYVFTDIAKAILQSYARNVTTRAGALEALMDVGLLSPDEAMTVEREPSAPDADADDEREEAELAAEIKANQAKVEEARAAKRMAAAEQEDAKPQPKPEKQKKVG